MSNQELNDYPLLAYHYKLAIATGVSKKDAKLFAQSQVNKLTDINHLNENH